MNILHKIDFWDALHIEFWFASFLTKAKPTAAIIRLDVDSNLLNVDSLNI